MKISESMIQMQADHSESVRDETRQTMVFREQRRPGGRLWGNPGSSLSGIWMDRVSLSSGQRRETEVAYGSAMSTRSRVRNLHTGEVQQFKSDSLAQGLVAGVMNQGALIRVQETGSGTGQADAGQSVSTDTLAAVRRTHVHTESEHLAFGARGQVTTEDGRVIDFSLDLSLDRSMISRTREETLVLAWQERVDLVDPLVISLDGRSPELTDTRFEFDLDSDGSTEQVSFVAKGSGFLAFDRNQDGKINNGSELFGPGTGNGFSELAALDEDQNGWIDENDRVFSQLSVWTRDDAGNDQLLSLKEAGLGAISLAHVRTRFDHQDGNGQLKGQMQQSGVFLFENGNVGGIHQIDLAVRPETAEAADLTPAALERPEPMRLQVWQPLPEMVLQADPPPGKSPQGPDGRDQKAAGGVGQDPGHQVRKGLKGRGMAVAPL